MKLSIIIPSYNRFDSLNVCLKKISEQTLPRDKFEVLVVDDGSTDVRYNTVIELFLKYKLTGRYFKQKNSGPASARNLGIKNSQNEIIVFIGDDMFPEKDCFQAHYEYHKKNPEIFYALLGGVSRPDEEKFRNSYFLEWLETTPFQFDFLTITSGETTDYLHFYTSNISLKRNFLLENGLFDESFPFAASEDTEIGYRLEKKGLKLIYEPRAMVRHDHFLEPQDYINRTRRVGFSASITVKLHPELCNVFEIKNDFVFRLKNQTKLFLGPIGRIFKIKKLIGWEWKAKIIKSYQIGYKEGLKINKVK